MQAALFAIFADIAAVILLSGGCGLCVICDRMKEKNKLIIGVVVKMLNSSDINRNFYDKLKNFDDNTSVLAYPSLGWQVAAIVALIAAVCLICLALGLGERYGVFSIIRTIFFVILLYFVLGAVLPVAHHKPVAAADRQAFTAESLYGDTAAEQVLCVDDNVEALVKRIQLINVARRDLVYSTMDFRDDESGQDVMAAMLAAADRGVRVRLLVDGLSSMNFLKSPYLRALAAHPNATVKGYNLPFLPKPWRLHMRLHDKYILVDETCYMIGGRNTSNLFLGDYGGRKNIDRELLVTADSKPQSMNMLQDYFLAMWQQNCCRTVAVKSVAKYDDKAAELRQRYQELRQNYPAAFDEDFRAAEMCEAGNVTLLHNHITPTNKAPLLWWQLCRAMERGRDILVQTPYLILSGGMQDDLRVLTSAEGRTVNVITNAVETGANAWGCSDYLNRKNKLLAAGLNIFECVSDDSCHLKSLMIDDRLSLVGSFNFDMRSAYLDTELMLVVDSPQLNRQLRQNARAGIDKSRLVKSDGSVTLGSSYKDVGMPRAKKILYSILRVVIIPFRHLL